MMPEATVATTEQVALGNPSFVWRAGQDRRLNLIRRYVDLEGARVLDIGCGIGKYVEKLDAISAQAYGVDVDPARVVQGKAGALSVAVSERLPFASGSFDMVLLNEVIEHVQDESATLREACRVLKPGGHVVIYAPNRLYPFETHGIYLGTRYIFGNIPLVNYLPDVLRKRLVPHARAYTSRGLRKITDKLDADLVVHTQVYPGFDNINARSGFMGKTLRSVFYRLEHTFMRAFGLSHFMILQTRGAPNG
jgi:ubiquinone/menaquinone biosynthesis C-methylase UbiE